MYLLKLTAISKSWQDKYVSKILNLNDAGKVMSIKNGYENKRYLEYYKILEHSTEKYVGILTILTFL